MADDVIEKTIAANDFHNGYRVAYVKPGGEILNHPPIREYPLASGALYERLRNRFDNPRYYSGDTAD
jgi:hypothetical protein